ncbi:hypothetical protein B0J18DRAFT_414059 [Chaetomium sp. MPI-SDFR-AT-0129]|nr:hypothetical protein B0J18DRAFT_414059 [Chaetomium sp. MPI-SDFR-AT-0129]
MTAAPGYDFRIDPDHYVWGSCLLMTLEATKCGLAGQCFDNYDCAQGCGATDIPYGTVTCTEADATRCAVAALTYIIATHITFTSIGCGNNPKSRNYRAYTGAAVPSHPSSPFGNDEDDPDPAGSTSTSNPTSTAAQPSQTATGPKKTPAPDASKTDPGVPTNIINNTNNTTTNNHNNNNNNNNNNNGNNNNNTITTTNNTAAIIGAIVGCLALLCACTVLIFWLRHRNNHNTNNKHTHPDATKPSKPSRARKLFKKTQSKSPPSSDSLASEICPAEFKALAQKVHLHEVGVVEADSHTRAINELGGRERDVEEVKWPGAGYGLYRQQSGRGPGDNKMVGNNKTGWEPPHRAGYYGTADGGVRYYGAANDSGFKPGVGDGGVEGRYEMGGEGYERVDWKRWYGGERDMDRARDRDRGGWEERVVGGRGKSVWVGGQQWAGGPVELP